MKQGLDLREECLKNVQMWPLATSINERGPRVRLLNQGPLPKAAAIMSVCSSASPHLVFFLITVAEKRRCFYPLVPEIWRLMHAGRQGKVLLDFGKRPCSTIFSEYCDDPSQLSTT